MSHLGLTSVRRGLLCPLRDPQAGTAFRSRRLHLRRVPTFKLALWCGTCPAVFTRLAEPADPRARDPAPLLHRAARIPLHSFHYRLDRDENEPHGLPDVSASFWHDEWAPRTPE
jgi:hypothetical protein